MEKEVKKEKRTENQIINDLVGNTIIALDKKLERINNIKEALKKNQANHYGWSKIETFIENGVIRDDQKLILEIKHQFGEGMLFAVMKKRIPSLREELKVVIKQQIDLLNEE